MGEKLLTAKEAAEILKVRKNTVYDMIKRGDLKASKLGKQLRIRQEDLIFIFNMEANMEARRVPC